MSYSKNKGGIKKKNPHLFLMLILAVALPTNAALVFSQPSTYSTEPGDYFFLDTFNRPDNTTIGSTDTGEAWTESGGNSKITENKLEQEHPNPNLCANKDFSGSELADIFTIEYTVKRGLNTALYAPRMRVWNTASCTGTVVSQTEWSDNVNNWQWLNNTGAEPLSPSYAVSGDLVLVKQVFVKSANTLNITVYDLDSNEEIISEKGTIPTFGQQYVDSLQSVQITSNANTGGERHNVTYIAVYNGTSPPLAPTNFAPTVSISSPSDGSKNNTDILEFVFIAQDDNDASMNCVLKNETEVYINESVVTNTTTTFNYTTTPNSFRDEDFTVECEDSEGLTGSDTVNVIIDRVNPLITINNPLNNTIDLDGTININVACADDNDTLYINATVYDPFFNQQFSQFNDSTATETLTVIATPSLSDGSYTINYTCADSHTKKNIPNFNSQKDVSEGRIAFYTDSTNVNITLIQAPAWHNLNDITTQKFSDRYSFNFESVGGNPQAGYFEFIITSSKPIKNLNSGYKAHFVTGNNWVDFENNDPAAVYQVWDLGDGSFKIGVTTDDLNFNSIGGLNIITTTESFTVNSQAPSISITSPANNSVVETTSVTVQLTATDDIENNINCSTLHLFNDILNATAFYEFEDELSVSNDATDSSPNGLHAQWPVGHFISEKPSKGGNGTGDQSVQFGGSTDFMHVLDDDKLDFPPPMTLSTWVYRDVAATDTIIHKNIDGNTAYQLLIAGGGQTFFTYSDDTVNTTRLTGAGTTPTLQWTHIVATINESLDITIWINGEDLTAGVAGSGNCCGNRSNERLYFGARNDGLQEFSGEMDNIALFNYSLTDAQAKLLFNEGKFRRQQIESQNQANGSSYTLGSQDFTEGLNNVTVNCHDNLNQQNELFLSIEADFTAPIISVTSPVAEQIISITNETLPVNWTGTDENLQTCGYSVYNSTDIIIQDSASATNDTLIFDTFHNISSFGVGGYTFTANCTDDYKTTTENINIHLGDPSIPIINLIAPANNTVFMYSLNSFTFGVDLLSNCELYINGIPNETLANISGTNTFYDVPFTENQSITWSVNCTTPFLVEGESGTFNLNISIIDLVKTPFTERFADRFACPDTLVDVILIIFFFLLAMIGFIIAIWYEWVAFAVLSGLLFMFCAFFLIGCSILIASILIILDIMLMVALAFNLDG